MCTYNRADILGECLLSLLKQTKSASDFDILVVDNNSNDNTTEVVQGLAADRQNLRLVREPFQGLSHARNRGLESVDAEWVAYLDDDAVVEPDWVERIHYIIETTNFSAFGGPYLPWYRDGKVEWYRDEYGTNLTWMPYKKVSTLSTKFFSGGNAVFRRRDALNCGGFPIKFGMQGESLGYGEENILQHRLRERGLVIGFDPHLVIHHLVPMKKQTLDWFRQRMITQGREYRRQNGITPSTQVLLSHLLTYAWIDMRNIATGLWRLIIREYRSENLYIAVIPPLLFQREVIRSLLASGKSET